jgi:hypothetical protein
LGSVRDMVSYWCKGLLQKEYSILGIGYYYVVFSRFKYGDAEKSAYTMHEKI